MIGVLIGVLIVCLGFFLEHKKAPACPVLLVGVLMGLGMVMLFGPCP